MNANENNFDLTFADETPHKLSSGDYIHLLKMEVHRIKRDLESDPENISTIANQLKCRIL